MTKVGHLAAETLLVKNENYALQKTKRN